MGLLVVETDLFLPVVGGLPVVLMVSERMVVVAVTFEGLVFLCWDNGLFGMTGGLGTTLGTGFVSELVGVASGVTTRSYETLGGVVCSMFIMRGLSLIGVCVTFGVAGDSAINCELLRYYGVPSLVLWGT